MAVDRFMAVDVGSRAVPAAVAPRPPDGFPVALASVHGGRNSQLHRRDLSEPQRARYHERLRAHGRGHTHHAPGRPPFHDLRHFYASLLIAHGCSVKSVQRRLGVVRLR